MALLILVSTYTIMKRFDQPVYSLQQGIRATSQQFLKPGSARIFHHDLPRIDASRWHKLIAKDRYQLKPKPLVMGFVLIPTKEGAVANYNVNRRHHYQLGKLENHPRRVPEEFDTVEIHHKQHTVVRGNTKLHWSFENTLVQALGTGVERQKDIKQNSKDYRKYQPDAPPEGCEPQYEWQTKSFPNCNNIHEVDILTRARTLNVNKEPESILLARGGYRDVWLVENNDVLHDESELTALKTLLYEHPWTKRNMDRHRRDALATDRLTGSPNALDLYGYCANTGIYEFANGGSLEDAVDDEEDWKTWNSTTKMKYAYQVAQAIADVHNIDKEGLASMSHTDISMSQFVSVNGGVDFKINDFNRARFLYRDKKKHRELCKFEVGSNKGKFRSPEEYDYKPETEKIDNYSMGNIFYVILTGKYPFDDVGKDEAKELVMKGERPVISQRYLESSDPLIKAMIEAIQMCWVHRPEKRATSRMVEQYLRPFATGEHYKHKHR